MQRIFTNVRLKFEHIFNFCIWSNEDLDLVKKGTKETTLTFYRNFTNNVPRYLSKKNFFALQNLRKIKDTTIQKTDKSNSAVIFDKSDYLDQMENLINEARKFEKNISKNDEILSFSVYQEKLVDNIFKKLVASNIISQERRRSSKAVGKRHSIMYGICKD